MKNFYLFLSGLVAIAFTACTNDDFLPEIAKKKITVTAYAADSNSDAATRIEQNKTDDGPIALTWSDDDAFSATRGGAFETFTKKADVENEFEGNEPTGNAEKFFAVYPAIAAETQATHTAVPFDISNQTEAFPYLMHAASSDGLTYQFHHAVAYLKVTFPEALKNQTVTITITTPEGVYTGGSINLENGTLSGETGDKNTITKQVTFGESTETWFALPPMAAENKVLSFSVETNSAIHTATLAGDNTKPIRAGHYYNATIASWATTTSFCVLPDGQTFNGTFGPSEKGDIQSIVFEANSTKTGVGQIGESTAYYVLEGNALTIYTDAPKFVFNADCFGMFSGFEKVTEIRFVDDCINTAKVTKMSDMFYGCTKLASLNLSSFNTEQVTDMGFMFGNCRSLSSLDLRNFNTAEVRNMTGMFSNCSSLTSLDLSNFNTAKVTNMSDMFNVCSKLASLNLSNFNTANVTNMSEMFYVCTKLASITFGDNFNTANVTNMSKMFQSCESLTSLDLSNFNTAKVTNMDSMFGNCQSLTSLDLSNFNTAKVTNMGYMFGACQSLTSLDLTNFNIAKVTKMSEMFYSCTKLASITFGDDFNTEAVTTMFGMFQTCSSLTSLDLSNFNTANVTNMNSMFNGCTKLASITFGDNFNTAKVIAMKAMFKACSSLTSLDLSSFTFKDNVDLTNMFSELGTNVANDGTTVLVKDEDTKTYLAGKSLGDGNYTIIFAVSGDDPSDFGFGGDFGN